MLRNFHLLTICIVHDAVSSGLHVTYLLRVSQPAYDDSAEAHCNVLVGWLVQVIGSKSPSSRLLWNLSDLRATKHTMVEHSRLADYKLQPMLPPWIAGKGNHWTESWQRRVSRMLWQASQKKGTNVWWVRHQNARIGEFRLNRMTATCTTQ